MKQLEQQQILVEDLTENEILNGDKVDLIVFNDDVNTFDWVIISFMEVCELSYQEAVQKTFYIHYNGVGVVRTDEYSIIKLMKEQLVERGLNAIIGRSQLN